MSDAAIQRVAHPMRVHSVFRSAVNLETDDGLLTIAPDSVGGLPNGILIADAGPRQVDFRVSGLRAGMPVVLDGTMLLVPATRFAVDLAHARPWSPRLTPGDGGRWPARSALVHRLAAERSVAGGLAAISSARPARTALTALAAAVTAADARAASHAACPLIGLGPGLTPSGDDALAGVEAALHALGHPVAGFLAGTLADRFGALDERTTAVSATLLRHAARGDFSERVQRLLMALLAPHDGDLPTAIDRAVAWGATSGLDVLLGVLLGLDAGMQARQAAA
jgi:hypothetical protein